MEHIIENLNKAFENRVRLGIMSVLVVNDNITFLELKDLLQITDGNLASHIAALEKLGYIKVHKTFIGKKPNTLYILTKTGRKAFSDHLNALEKIIRKHK